MTRRSLLAAMAMPTFAAKDAPVRRAKVVKLYRSPDGHPNALEATREGFWLGEQVTDRAYLLNPETGRVIHRVETESSNTSGIAYGAGSIWMAANGKAIERAPRPTDATTGEVVEVDPKTGKTKSRHAIPGGGGVHGLEIVGYTMWITSLRIQKLSQVMVKGFEVIHQIPVHLGRAHGLAWAEPDSIWCMHSTERVIHRLDANDGTLREVIQLAAEDPDPHGMCLYKGHLYYCDAGIAPGATSNKSPHAGWVCRVDPV